MSTKFLFSYSTVSHPFFLLLQAVRKRCQQKRTRIFVDYRSDNKDEVITDKVDDVVHPKLLDIAWLLFDHGEIVNEG